MIPRDYVTEWRQQAPRGQDSQVEQDLGRGAYMPLQVLLVIWSIRARVPISKFQGSSDQLP